MRTIFFIGICLCSFTKTLAQEAAPTGKIKGIVVDEKTQLPVPGVNIIIDGRNSMGTTTDANGSFALTNLPDGKYGLVISSIGYSIKRLTDLVVGKGELLDIGTIDMEEDAILLSEVTVTPGSFSIMGDKDLSASHMLSGEDIKNISWSEDITRAVARLPGVSSTDFSSKFSVRGGESDEILMTLDGMELYDPFHQRDISGGLFSIVDIEAIQGIDLMTGGFSAEYGNRQSAVFNMKTKRIKDGERHTSIGLSMMNARFYTDGTFANNKGSYQFSARRGMLDLIFKVVASGESIPYYSDVMGKVEYKLNDKHTLSFHTLRADDKTKRSDLYLTNYDSSNIKYSNTYSWLTLKSFYNPKLFSQTLLFAGFNDEDRNGSYDKDEYGDIGTFLLTDKRSFKDRKSVV